jgi:putative methyltransferase (TIGR04325 family)
MKAVIKLFIPPAFIKLYYLIKNRGSIQFKTTSLSWSGVLKKVQGYSSENILIKCRDALLKVKNGEYPYERDSVLFKEKEIFYPLLSSLFYVSLQNNNKLNLIDFGGSLGSSYFQNKEILKQAEIAINWNIVEQENFVKCGKEHFENDELRFFNQINEDEIANNIHTCLFSSVLPYLENPYAVFDTVTQSNIKYIIIDRTFFIDNAPDDILAIQTVPKEIYEVSYPVWFLSLNKFLKYINKYFNIIFKWQALDQHNLKGFETAGLGFLLVRK